MARRAATVAQLLGAVLLAAVAAIGVALSASVAWCDSSAGGASVAGWLSRTLDGVVAGSVSAERVELLPDGAIAVRGLAVHDPDGHEVLTVRTGRVRLEVASLLRRVVRGTVELEAPSLSVDVEPDGALSIGRAFAPSARAPGGERRQGEPWSVEVTSVHVREGRFALRRDGGRTAAALGDLSLDGEGSYAPARSHVRLRVRGPATEPVDGPFALDVAARMEGSRLDVPLLDASVGGTALSAIGQADLERGAFRFALTRLALRSADAQRIVPTPVAGDLGAAGYAQSDGAVVTGAFELASTDAERGPRGSGAGAVALRLGRQRAAGFDVALVSVDPSALVAQAPPGEITLSARGAIAWSSLQDATGSVAVEISPSRVGGGELDHAAFAAVATRGSVEVTALDARLPGAALSGSGRWVRGGAVDGVLSLDVADCARAARNLAALSGVSLPDLTGRILARARLSGSAASPTLSARVEAPLLGVGPVRIRRAIASGAVVGTPSAPAGRVDARAETLEAAGASFRAVALAASLARGEATWSLSALAGARGGESVQVTGAARVAGGAALVRSLSVIAPKARLSLVRPARVRFDPPGVDRLELAEGRRTVALAGGLRERGALDVALELEGLDLATLARSFAPGGDGVGGELSVAAKVTGTTRDPVAAAHLTVVDGEVRGIRGLRVAADARWTRGVLAAELSMHREAGGALSGSATLPLSPGAARSSERVALQVDASGWPVEALTRAAGVEVAASGALGLRAELTGTVGAPRLNAALALDDGSFDEVEPLSGTVNVEASAGVASVAARAKLAETELADGEARFPLDVAELLRRPAETLEALRRAPMTGAVRVPGADLSALAGKGGLAEDLAGIVSGTVAFRGSAAAPRGEATLSIARATLAGYRGVTARLDAAAEPLRTAFAARASVGGAEALRLEGSLGVAVEQLTTRAALRDAPLSVTAEVPALPLGEAGGEVPLSGVLSASLVAGGSLGAPGVRLDFSGAGVEVRGRRLGDVTGSLRSRAGASVADAVLRPAAGGEVRATATLQAALGIGVDRAALRDAPATLRITSEGLDLAFLPALAPELVRGASGKLTVDLAASGPLASLRPRGSVSLEGGRLALSEVGEWFDVALVASLGDREIDVSKLEARRRSGRLSGALSLRDLGTPVAKLAGRVVFKDLPISRYGSDLASLDFPLELEGTLTDRLLDATVTLPAGTIRLPKRASGELQSLAGRSDVVEVDAAAERARRAGAAAASVRAPLDVRCRVVIPGKLVVRGEKPAMNVEVKADTTWHVTGGAVRAEGSLETLRGTVEPIGGRVFTVERGRVTLPGTTVDLALLDVVARYDNPSAVVTVTISGTVAKPVVQFSSRPPMDEAAIAMLLATGRSEMNVNTGGVAALTPQQAGQAMAGAAMSAAFSDIVAGKLPIDQISFDTSTVRAGKYLTDKLFVGYARYFDAKVQEGENENEVKAQYRLSARWNVEVRYGDAQSGDASLIWSKDY